MTNTILTLLSWTRITEEYASGHWRDETIYQLARRHAQARPDKIAIRDRSGGLTYADLVGRADALADRFGDAGLRAGHRVAVWLPSRVETAIVLLACSRNGYVCCPSLHRDHTAGAVVELLQAVRAAGFVGEIGYGADSRIHDVFTRLAEVPSLRLVVRLGNAGDGAASPLPGAASSERPINIDPNVVSYLAFTSGTTGRPKGVMHSDHTLLANARAMIGDWKLGVDTVIYSMSPLSHNLGFGSLVTAIAAGGELVVHDVPRGASVLDRLLEVGATFIVGVPTHAMDLLGEIKSRGAEAPSTVKGFRISGAAAPQALVAELLRHGVVPQSGYGMTEAGSHHYTRPDDSPETIVQTSGRACDGYEVKIWSSENVDVEAPVGEVGQIGGRGASLMLGYFDNQVANEEAFNAHGWFLTGDLGRVDERGYLQITGRKKDLIIRGGHNIFPARPSRTSPCSIPLSPAQRRFRFPTSDSARRSASPSRCGRAIRSRPSICWPTWIGRACLATTCPSTTSCFRTFR